MNLDELLKLASAPGVQNTGHVGGAGTIDLGWTEWLAKQLGQNATPSGSQVVPGANTTGAVLGAVSPTGYAAAKAVSPYIANDPRNNFAPTTQTPPPTNNPDPNAQKSGAGGGGGNNDTTVNPTGEVPNGFNEMIALARAAADEGRRRAGEAFNRARGIYDEGLGVLGKRKQEFKDLFDTGRETILDRYEGERGNLQASSEGARTRMSNALRALGLGGSAFIKSEGRQTQNEAKALGGLQTERNTNENANQNEFDTRQDWASTQEAALGRYLQDAEENRRASENQSDLVGRGDVAQINNNISSYLQNMYNTQAALAAAGKGIGEFQANPYAVNMSNMVGALNGAAPTVGGQGATGVQDVNLKEQDPTLALLKRRGGVAGAGLYGRTA